MKAVSLTPSPNSPPPMKTAIVPAKITPIIRETILDILRNNPVRMIIQHNGDATIINERTAETLASFPARKREAANKAHRDHLINFLYAQIVAAGKLDLIAERAGSPSKPIGDLERLLKLISRLNPAKRDHDGHIGAGMLNELIRLGKEVQIALAPPLPKALYYCHACQRDIELPYTGKSPPKWKNTECSETGQFVRIRLVPTAPTGIGPAKAKKGS